MTVETAREKTLSPFPIHWHKYFLAFWTAIAMVILLFSSMFTMPNPVSVLCDLLGVPPSEREIPIQLVVGGAYLVEIREHENRWYLCGQLNELPIPVDDPALESLLELPFPVSACGFVSFESSTGSLLYWSEILPVKNGLPPRPDLKIFIRELSNLCKKVSLEGVL